MFAETVTEVTNQANSLPGGLSSLKQEIGWLVVLLATYAAQEFRFYLQKKKLNTVPESAHADIIAKLTEQKTYIDEALKSQRQAVEEKLTEKLAPITATIEAIATHLKVWQILSKDAVFEADSTANFTMVSESLCALLGISSESQARGKGWLLAVDTAVRQKVWSVWEESVEQGLPYDEVIPIRTKDGTMRNYRFLALPQLHPDSKKVLMYLGVVEAVAKKEPLSHGEL